MSHSSKFDTAPGKRQRVDWLRAFRAIGVMRADPNRTDQVFELNVALDGGDSERQFQVFLAEPAAAKLLAERPCLLDRLSDFAALRGLPSGSLGRTYLGVMERAGYDPDGLRREAGKIAEFAELHPSETRSWFAERGNCIHDLLHVVSGYGHDPAGETALLAFTHGVYGRRARMRVLGFGLVASLFSAPRGSRLRAIAFARRARRRGARACIAFSYRWEAALPRALDEVRADLGVEPVARTHPAGVLRGARESAWSFGPALC